MSMRTQRLANRFPLWTQVRKDPSSLGQRFLSVFADVYQFGSASQFRMKDELNLFKWDLGQGALYVIDLDEADYMTVAGSASGARIDTPPTSVVGTIAATPYACTQLLSLEELLGGLTTRLTAVQTHTGVNAFTVWVSTAPETYNTIDIPNRLTIRVQDSIEYKKRTRFRHRQFGGFHGLILTGLDENYVEFEETVEVLDDGLFTTRNIFKKLLAVRTDGFDGTVTISANSSGQNLLNDIYNVAVGIDFEGPMELRVTPTQTDLGTNAALLEMTTQRLKLGSEYRTGATSIIDNTEQVCQQLLRTSAGAHFTPVDSALSFRNMRLYVLDDAANLHIYEHDLPEFLPPSIDIPLTESTETASVEVQPLQPYIILDSTEKLWTWLARPRFPIGSVSIRRRTPGGVVEYLQANKTWAAGVYAHSYEPDALTPETSWQDFEFSTLYDEIGQWEYYCTTTSKAGTATVYTAVYVAAPTAAVSLATGVAGATTLHFGANGNLFVGDGTDLYEIAEAGDYYLADFSRQRILLRENYDSVTVTI